jgi:cytochrome bd-type quinol oxidase subunit 2
MLTETIFDRFPIWLLYAGTALLLLAGRELGFRLSSRHKAGRTDGEKAPANAMMGSTLGLLAFILAFTFGMSSTRFDARKQLVLDEASAIFKTYQRVQFLPEPQRAESSRLLREYVALRIHLISLKSLEEMQAAMLRSEALQEALWKQAATLADRPSAILAGLMQSLSEITDLQMKRVRAAVWNRIPSAIVLMLYVIAFLGLATIGYGAGLSETRATIPSLVLVFAFSAIIVLIIDLERPRQQLFTITQEPMVDVARRIQLPQP